MMISTVVTVSCDWCDHPFLQQLELHWVDLPDRSDIASNLNRLQWATRDGDKHCCPECAKKEAK